jgi:hypothetical protein
MRLIVPAKLWFIFVLALGTLPGLRGYPEAPAPWAIGQSRPEDLVVTLATIDPSEPIYTWWGHTALIIEDTRLSYSRLYNYGLFTIDQDDFVTNFVMGRLWFQVGAVATQRELEWDRRMNRSVRLQTLDLSPARTMVMARFLETNVLPENRVYLYDHYYDNCATRVRDVVDQAVDGQLFETTNQLAELTLRQATRRYTARHPLMDWLLMFLMSEAIDRPVTRWEQMFLPGELERYVGGLVYGDEEGREKPLVSQASAYFEARDFTPIPDRAPPHWPWGLAVGIICGAAASGLGYWTSRGSGAGRVLFGIFNTTIGLGLGILGSVLFFMSKFTDHWVTYSNENLFLANPLALLLVPLGIALAADGARSRRLVSIVWYFLTTVAVVYLMLKSLPVFRQDNWLAVATLLPVLVGFSEACFLLRAHRR